MRRLLPLVLLLAGCAPDPAVRADLTRAADDLRAELTVPSRLAAAALLVHARTGQFPETPFALLGSPEARATGLAPLPLSALDLDATEGGVRIAYTQLPTRAKPSDRGGSLTVAPDSSGYRVDIALDHRADADFGGQARPITQRGAYAVVRANSAFWASAEGVAAQGEALDAPLRTDKRLRVHFRPLAAAPLALRDGLTVVLSD